MLMEHSYWKKSHLTLSSRHAEGNLLGAGLGANQVNSSRVSVYVLSHPLSWETPTLKFKELEPDQQLLPTPGAMASFLKPEGTCGIDSRNRFLSLPKAEDCVLETSGGLDQCKEQDTRATLDTAGQQAVEDHDWQGTQIPTLHRHRPSACAGYQQAHSAGR
ncbi:hypothetical protein CB1_000350077 [Camelus ferus]|nr:hypothetical protein CB1_000350077 [Camelus ferus]